jgi:hypothetical protein
MRHRGSCASSHGVYQSTMASRLTVVKKLPINSWMNETIAFTGGARLGWVHATWPFGRLSISSGQLTISLGFVGQCTFATSEVSGLERCGIASNGIRIVHTRSDYPETIIFWCGARVQRVLDAATRAGFGAQVTSSPPPRRGMPFRWVAVVQVVVVWNVLGFLDQGLRPRSDPRLPGLLMIAALGMLPGVAFAIQISEAAQAWALKPGRSVSEVAPLLRLVQLVGGFLFAGLALQMLFWRG